MPTAQTRPKKRPYQPAHLRRLSGPESLRLARVLGSISRHLALSKRQPVERDLRRVLRDVHVKDGRLVLDWRGAPTEAQRAASFLAAIENGLLVGVIHRVPERGAG